MKTWPITTFYGGIALDDSLGRSNQFGRNTRHIDIYAEPGSIRPQWGLATDHGGDLSTSVAINDFLVGSDGKIYAIGEDGDGHGNIYHKSSVSGNWTEVEISTNAGCYSRMFEYKDYIYMWGDTASDYIARYGTLSGAPSMTAAHHTLSRTTEGPMIEQKQNLYVAYDNKLASYDGSTWTDTALDLQDDWLIKSLCRWGKYIVIGAYFNTTWDTQSRLFFWDTSYTTWNFSKECPYGELKFIRNIGDRIVGCIGVDTDVMNFGSMAIFEWSGGECVVKRRHRWGDYSGAHRLDTNDAAVDTKEGVVYFAASMTNDYDGVYSWGQTIPGESKSLHFERKPRNTDLDHPLEIKALKWIGSKLHVSVWDSTDADYEVTRDLQSTTWNEEGIYESLIFSGDEPYRNKEIEKIVLTTKPLPSNTTITLKIKADRASSWTTVGTFTTANGTQESFYKLSDDSNFPHFKELQLRVEMTGTGDEPPILTGLYTLYNPINF